MIKTSLIIYIVLLFSINSFQNDKKEYEFLNSEIYKILYIPKNETIIIKEAVLDITSINNSTNEVFFSQIFWKNYHEGVLGTNSENVIKLEQEIDFNYLNKQIVTKDKWNFNLLNFNAKKYKKYKIKKGTYYYGVSKPIFSKNGDYVFVYIEKLCDYDLCGSGTVKVFKRNNSSWDFYVQFPVWLS